MRINLAKSAKRAHGFVLIFVVLAMLTVFGVVLFGNFATGNPKGNRDLQTAIALAKAKEALIAYATARADDVAPGEFPCPTIVAPTSATYGVAAGGCATIRIGRLPWQTLGLPEILDGNNEPVWYALSTNFRPGRPVASKINGETAGSLTIYQNDGTTILATRVVAVIFSAGAPAGSQSRTNAVAFCTTTGTNIAGNTCAANYLEIASSRNNATNAGPYIAAKAVANFNDQLVYITTDDFIPRIEDRIITMLKRTLNDYYAVNGYYPYAANYLTMTPTSANCATNTFTGRLPNLIAPSCASLADWQPVGNPNGLPAWFTTEQWNAGIYYAIGKAYEKGGLKTCVAVGDCLTVDGDNAVQAVFILPGTALAGQTRPSTAIANYIEENVENQDGWPGPGNYTFVNGSSKLASRDRVIALKN